jgi:hypothetical protein
MVHHNLSLDSREYKIILNPNIFKNHEKSRNKLIDIMNKHANAQQGILEVDEKLDIRKTWYLDTKKYDLYDKNLFLLRIREEYDRDARNVKGYDITFKNRHPDRLIAASYDVSNIKEISSLRLEKKPEIKFEEDIVTPFASKYSSSVKLDLQTLPILTEYQHLQSIFPNLRLDIPLERQLTIVKGFVANEISYTLGRLKFDDETEARVQYSLWYESRKKKTPVIAEFDIDIKVDNTEKSNKDLLEGFPISLLNSIYNIYQGLQKEDIARFKEKGSTHSKSPKTKTQYAYEYKK